MAWRFDPPCRIYLKNKQKNSTTNIYKYVGETEAGDKRKIRGKQDAVREDNVYTKEEGTKWNRERKLSKTTRG